MYSQIFTARPNTNVRTMCGRCSNQTTSNVLLMFNLCSNKKQQQNIKIIKLQNPNNYILIMIFFYLIKYFNVLLLFEIEH